MGILNEREDMNTFQSVGSLMASRKMHEVMPNSSRRI